MSTKSNSASVATVSARMYQHAREIEARGRGDVACSFRELAELITRYDSLVSEYCELGRNEGTRVN